MSFALAPGLPDRRPRIVHSSPELVIASVGNVHFTVYRVCPTVPLLELDQKHHEALAGLHRETAVLTVARYGLSLPSDEVRTRASALVQRNARFVQRAATVIEGDGFWASAARSTVTAVFLLARQPYPSRVFVDVPSAGQWIRDCAALSPDELASLVAIADGTFTG